MCGLGPQPPKWPTGDGATGSQEKLPYGTSLLKIQGRLYTVAGGHTPIAWPRLCRRKSEAKARNPMNTKNGVARPELVQLPERGQSLM